MYGALGRLRGRRADADADAGRHSEQQCYITIVLTILLLLLLLSYYTILNYSHAMITIVMTDIGYW